MDKNELIINQYPIEPVQIRKGRACVLVDTAYQTYSIEEYSGPTQRAQLQEVLLNEVHEKSSVRTETVLRNKENEVLSKDRDMKRYICKTYFEGRECDPYCLDDCKRAVKNLCLVQKAMFYPAEQDRKTYHFQDEVIKHNRDLLRGKKFLRTRNSKSTFELELLKEYDHYAKQAEFVNEWIKKSSINDFENLMREAGAFCHGDFQYHNVIFSDRGDSIMHFEKWCYDVHIRDFYHFFRKVMEKNNWDEALGNTLISTYTKNMNVNDAQLQIFFFHLFYPEKYWKTVNFYMNHNKAFVSDKKNEKCLKQYQQEKTRLRYLQKLMIDILPMREYNRVKELVE